MMTYRLVTTLSTAAAWTANAQRPKVCQSVVVLREAWKYANAATSAATKAVMMLR